MGEWPRHSRTRLGRCQESIPSRYSCLKKGFKYLTCGGWVGGAHGPAVAPRPAEGRDRCLELPLCGP